MRNALLLLSVLFVVATLGSEEKDRAAAGKARDEMSQWAISHYKHRCPYWLLEHERNQPVIQTPDFHPLMEMPPQYVPLNLMGSPELTRNDEMVDGSIPKVIITSHARESVPADLFNNIRENFDKNDGYTLKYFSDHTARDFVQMSMNPTVLKAYDSLVPGQFKADLFRLCYIYANGGIWMDADIVEQQGFSDVVRSEHSALILWDPHREVADPMILGAAARHPVVGRALELAVDNILNRSYGAGPTAITGSLVLTEALLLVYPQFKTTRPGSIKVFTKTTGWYCAISQIWSAEVDGPLFAWSSYPEYWREMKSYAKDSTFNYEGLWTNRSVFATKSAATSAARKCLPGAGAKKAGTPRHIADVEKELADILPYHPPKTASRFHHNSDPDVMAKKTHVENHQPGSQIPRRIVQFGITDRVPKRMRAAMESILADNPTFHHVYFNYARAAKFIKDNCGVEVINAFQQTVVHDYKQDLFKYCYLYHHGGVFVDSRFTADDGALTSLTDAVSDVAFFGALVPPTTSSNEEPVYTIHGGVLGIIEKSQVMIVALDNAVKNVERRHYGSSWQNVTGSEVFTKVFSSLIGAPSHSITPYSDIPLKTRFGSLVSLPGCTMDEIRLGGGPEKVERDATPMPSPSPTATENGEESQTAAPVTNSVAPAATKTTTQQPPKRLFWTGYTGFDDDAKWYTILDDEDPPEAKEVWAQRRAFGEKKKN